MESHAVTEAHSVYFQFRPKPSYFFKRETWLPVSFDARNTKTLLGDRVNSGLEKCVPVRGFVPFNYLHIDPETPVKKKGPTSQPLDSWATPSPPFFKSLAPASSSKQHSLYPISVGTTFKLTHNSEVYLLISSLLLNGLCEITLWKDS